MNSSVPRHEVWAHGVIDRLDGLFSPKEAFVAMLLILLASVRGWYLESVRVVALEEARLESERQQGLQLAAVRRERDQMWQTELRRARAKMTMEVFDVAIGPVHAWCVSGAIRTTPSDDFRLREIRIRGCAHRIYDQVLHIQDEAMASLVRADRIRPGQDDFRR